MEKELELGAVIGFQGKLSLSLSQEQMLNMLISHRQSKLRFDPSPRQRAHHLPTGHHNRR